MFAIITRYVYNRNTLRLLMRHVKTVDEMGCFWSKNASYLTLFSR